MVWFLHWDANHEDTRSVQQGRRSLCAKVAIVIVCYSYDITLTILSPLYRKDTFELKTVTNKVLGLEKDKGLKEKEYENYVLGTNNEW